MATNGQCELTIEEPHAMSERLIILPGLVDMHAHLREPGYTKAEDFSSGTRAALEGGIVAVLDMPNNRPWPTTTPARLTTKIRRAEQSACTDVGFYFGAAPDEQLEIGSPEYCRLAETFTEAGKSTFGLKLYCDITTGNQHRHDARAFRSVVHAWLAVNPGRLILAHVEGGPAITAMIDLVAREQGGRLHITHISKREELEAVIRAKQDPALQGRVTAGVCPHHLFLTQSDIARLGWYGRMKPSLGLPSDRDFLRNHISDIDVIETDHAPHTTAAKNYAQWHNPHGEVGTGKPACFGIPGLETMLPLLLQAKREGWLTVEQISEKASATPARLLGIDVSGTEVHVTEQPHILTKADIYSKCGWSAYTGMEVGGQVRGVVVRGVTKVLNGKVLARPGDGRVLLPAPSRLPARVAG